MLAYLIATSAVGLGALWGGFSEEIYWPEVLTYIVLAVLAWGIAFFAPHSSAPAIGLGILAVTGIVLLFRVGLANIRA